MTTRTARAVGELDFSPFGTHLRLVAGGAGVDEASRPGWRDLSTAAELIRGPAQIGMTTGDGAPYAATHMERHRNTDEVIVCTTDPIVLALAPAGDTGAPSADDVEVVLLQRGDIVTLHAGTWHDACHGVGSPAEYLWIAARVDGADATWVPIEGGPVDVRC
jgi:ureidoglycolate lyase